MCCGSAPLNVALLAKRDAALDILPERRARIRQPLRFALVPERGEAVPKEAWPSESRPMRPLGDSGHFGGLLVLVAVLLVHQVVQLRYMSWQPFNPCRREDSFVVVEPGSSGFPRQGAGSSMVLKDAVGDHPTNCLAPSRPPL